jgi:hypothetical protein
MPPTVKYNGSGSKLLYVGTVDTAPTIDLSGSSREITIDESGKEQEVSTRDDVQANATAYLSGPPERSVDINGLDTTPHASRTWAAINVGDAGRVAVYPLGSSPTGLPYKIGNVIATKSNYSSPHDTAAKWQVSWRVNGTWTPGTT